MLLRIVPVDRAAASYRANRPVLERLYVDMKDLSLRRQAGICGRPVHRGFSPNDKAGLVAMFAGNPDPVGGLLPFLKGESSCLIGVSYSE